MDIDKLISTAKGRFITNKYRSYKECYNEGVQALSELVRQQLLQQTDGSSSEYIMCSAIHYDDGLTYMYQPKNITTGIIICGIRHRNIIYNWNKLSKGKTKGTDTQGFLTNTDRFVDRKEAFRIAVLANQIIERTGSSTTDLYSEDVW